MISLLHQRSTANSSQRPRKEQGFPQIQLLFHRLFQSPSVTNTFRSMTRHTDNQVWSTVSNNNNDQEFPHNYWDFQPAVCNTPVAMTIRRTSTRQQENLAEELANFIQQDTVNFARLNADLRPATWVILVPGSTHRLRVLYGVPSGYGVGGLNDESLDSSIIWYSWRT